MYYRLYAVVTASASASPLSVFLQVVLDEAHVISGSADKTIKVTDRARAHRCYSDLLRAVVTTNYCRCSILAVPVLALPDIPPPPPRFP